MSRLYFITSSRIKFLHAEHLATTRGVELQRQSYYGRAYIEPRSNNREELLKQSFDDAMKRWEKTASKEEHLFFIEDTSVIIPSLSSSECEYPGLDVKYWIQQTAFEELDALLKKAGNDRRAIVRSDVLLYVPKRMGISADDKVTYHRFVGKTHGTITEREHSIKTNPVFPWLDQNSFNKWFVPNGESKPLGSLPIERADKHDIRTGSIGAMLEFILNSKIILPQAQYDGASEQLPQALPFKWNHIFVILGLSCAGKTTLGDFLTRRCGFRHLEASDFMRVAYAMRMGANQNDSLDSFAKKILKKNPAVVVDQMLKEIASNEIEPLVITGFRSPEELKSFQRQYKGPLSIEPLWIEASPAIRFKRCRLRDREDAPTTAAAFRERDSLQRAMGLSEVCRHLKTRTLKNAETPNKLFKEFKTRFQIRELDKPLPSVETLLGKRFTLGERILLALFYCDRDKSFTTTEISKLINERFYRSTLITNKNNVSRYFNQKIRPYFRISQVNKRKVYRLSQTGISKAMTLVFSASRQPATEIQSTGRGES